MHCSGRYQGGKTRPSPIGNMKSRLLTISRTEHLCSEIQARSRRDPGISIVLGASLRRTLRQPHRRGTDAPSYGRWRCPSPPHTHVKNDADLLIMSRANDPPLILMSLTLQTRRVWCLSRPEMKNRNEYLSLQQCQGTSPAAKCHCEHTQETPS